MSKMPTEPKPLFSITAEQLIELCKQLNKEDKYQELIAILKAVSIEEASVIHSYDDIAFISAAEYGRIDVMKILLDSVVTR